MGRNIVRKKYGYHDIRAWKRNKELLDKSIKEGANGRVGYVYIFKLYDNFYKIGYASDIQGRMKTLRASCPTLNCIWSAHVRDMVIVEQKLHKHFKKKKYDREIFILSPNDIKEADLIADKYR